MRIVQSVLLMATALLFFDGCSQKSDTIAICNKMSLVRIPKKVTINYNNTNSTICIKESDFIRIVKYARILRGQCIACNRQVESNNAICSRRK